MSIYKQFATSENAEVTGVRVECEANADGSIPTFILARMGGANKQYTAELTRATAAHANAIRMNLLSEATARTISLSVFCKTVLRGWENVCNQDGETIPHSVDAAVSLMTQLPALYDLLVATASNIATFKQDALEHQAKN